MPSSEVATVERTAMNLLKQLRQGDVERVKAQAGLQFPDDAMLSVRIFAYLSIPKSVSKKKRTAMLEGLIRPTKKPDHDNIGKIVCDALNGIAYRDDAQIVDSLVRKFYSDKPCVLVEISDIPYKT